MSNSNIQSLSSEQITQFLIAWAGGNPFTSYVRNVPPYDTFIWNGLKLIGDTGLTSAEVAALITTGGDDTFAIQRQSDLGVNFVLSGLTLPATGTLGIASIAQGIAYINGARLAVLAQVLALTATKDNYVDLSASKAITITPVTIAAGAPAVAANSIRLGYITTGATTITSATTGVADSLGNWMGNNVSTACCQLRRFNNASLGTAVTNLSWPAGNTILDNFFGHDSVGQPTRITIVNSGLYFVSWEVTLSSGFFDSVRMRVNGANDLRFPTIFSGTGQLAPRASSELYLNAGDYIEVQITPNAGSAPFAFYTYFNCRRVA